MTHFSPPSTMAWSMSFGPPPHHNLLNSDLSDHWTEYQPIVLYKFHRPHIFVFVNQPRDHAESVVQSKTQRWSVHHVREGE